MGERPLPKSFVPDSFVPDTPASTEKTDTGLGALVSHYAQQINPLPLGQLLPFPQSWGGAGMDAPVQAMKNLLEAQGKVKEAGDAAWNQGNHIDAARHYLHWLLPVIGPVLDKAGDELQQGKIAAGTGDTLGLATTLFGPNAAKAALTSDVASRMASAAEQQAVRGTVKTLAPAVGPNKIRLGNQLASVAPDVLQGTTAVTKGGMLEQASMKAAQAFDALDAAYDNVPGTKMYATMPIRAGLEAAIKKLTVSGIGGQVEPATRAAQIASLRSALDEVKGLGSVANIDNLRKLRIAWDQGAQAQFAPAVAADYLTTRGTGAGWADARTALNQYLVTQHPELAGLNADAHVWKTATDVMQAAEEADRVRPTVGRSIMARGLGAAVGGASQGPMGAAAGAVLAPTFERALGTLAPTTKLLVSRQLANLADAIRAGQTSRVTSLVSTIRGMMSTAAQQGGQSLVNTPAATELRPVISGGLGGGQ